MSVIHGSIRATSVSFRLVKCPVCGEKFTRTSEHAWKGRVGTNLVDVCSYHCQRACERKYQSRPDGRKSRSKVVSIEKLTARRDACLHMMETMVKEIEDLRRDKLWLALPPAKRRSMTDARGYWKQCYEEASQKLDQAIAEKQCG